MTADQPASSNLPSVDLEEAQWRDQVFLGDKVPELTPRAIAAGMLLGVLIMSENVYMGLKTGITEAGSILSAILCFAFFRSIRTSCSVLENNTAQTISSAAGSIGIVVSVVPALHLVGYTLTGFQIFLWVFLVAALGLLIAIPLRRQLIVVEKLTFPTGTACAATITAMHAKGEDAVGKAKALGLAGLISAAVTWFRDAVPIVIPTTSTLPLAIGRFSLEQLSLGIYWSPLVVGIGLLIGIRIGVSLLLGAAAGWVVLGPLLATNNVIGGIGHTDVTHWTMWPAIALMVASGFTSLAMKRGMIGRTFKSMRAVSYDRSNLIEFPFRVWAILLVVIVVALLLVMQLVLQLPVWLGAVAVVLSFVFSSVAIRAYGETDINPVGPMGHANQIAAGMLSPGSPVTNLAAGGVAAGCSDVSADLLQVLKTGYLVGASPRRQVSAQFIGVAVGAIVSVLVYSAVTGVYGIGTENVPAPGAIPWSGMATLLSKGTAALPPFSLSAIIIGGLLGILLSMLEKSKLGKYIPSPFGMGLGLVVPGFISISIFLGSVVGFVMEKKFPSASERYLIPVASGGIAGEAIMGVLISILTILGLVSA